MKKGLVIGGLGVLAYFLFFRKKKGELVYDVDWKAKTVNYTINLANGTTYKGKQTMTSKITDYTIDAFRIYVESINQKILNRDYYGIDIAVFYKGSQVISRYFNFNTNEVEGVASFERKPPQTT